MDSVFHHYVLGFTSLNRHIWGWNWIYFCCISQYNNSDTVLTADKATLLTDPHISLTRSLRQSVCVHTHSSWVSTVCCFPAVLKPYVFQKGSSGPLYLCNCDTHTHNTEVRVAQVIQIRAARFYSDQFAISFLPNNDSVNVCISRKIHCIKPCAYFFTLSWINKQQDCFMVRDKHRNPSKYENISCLPPNDEEPKDRCGIYSLSKLHVGW